MNRIITALALSGSARRCAGLRQDPARTKPVASVGDKAAAEKAEPTAEGSTTDQAGQEGQEVEEGRQDRQDRRLDGEAGRGAGQVIASSSVEG